MTACPSVTAWAVARMRAKHQMVDGAAVFADPFAVPILAADGRELMCEPDSPHAKRYRGFIAVRSRVADDGVIAARRRGVRQIVILGAGLDTTGLRHVADDGALCVFEVDRPEMQIWKRAHLDYLGIVPSRSLAFVPVDFEYDSLSEKLRQAGLAVSEPAFFVWLGVVPYLTQDAILGTLRFASTFPASEIVFDFSEPAEDLSPTARAAFEQRRQQVAQAGEPWISHFRPAQLHALLREAGFSDIMDRDRAALCVEYGLPSVAGSSSGAHVVHARRC